MGSRRLPLEEQAIFAHAKEEACVITRGIVLLRERGIEHEVLPYDYRRSGARPAADALGLPHAVVVKSLVFRAVDGAFLFALIGGDANVSERKLGRASGHKHVAPASPRDAERLTGYRVGGISPFGAKRDLPVVLDETTARHGALVINAGERGVLVRLATADLIALLDPIVADIRGV
jgi:Cys-tRNA(Pro)/Cys-tRNA(Cys) deacylase